jgi:two-component system, LuxR family, response regulator FixJ
LVKAPLVAIVDDDDDLREALSDLLLVVGLACRTFDRAETLLAEYRPGLFDCIVTDVRMPGIGGLGLLRHLRGAEAPVPVIIATSVTEPKARQQALDGGAHAWLVKPVDSHVLLGHIKAALARGGLPAGGDEPTGVSDG